MQYNQASEKKQREVPEILITKENKYSTEKQ